MPLRVWVRDEVPKQWRQAPSQETIIAIAHILEIPLAEIGRSISIEAPEDPLVLECYAWLQAQLCQQSVPLIVCNRSDFENAR